MLTSSNFRKTSKCSYYEKFLLSRKFPIFPIDKVSMNDVKSVEALKLNDFSVPFVIVDNSKELGLVLPDTTCTLATVADVIGPNHPVKLIEVGQQHEISDRTLGEYAHYLENRTPDHKVLNMISLEISTTAFNGKVQAPKFVREIDWIDLIWPLDRRARGDYPKVQKYCLAGMAGSYTDFHIDFGGTSVWYHILRGKKRFYLVAPTVSNLKAFEAWSSSISQSDVFFADMVPGKCFQFDLEPGQTFTIPSGWIHAVYTPTDSIVFGGNYVHSLSILKQLQVFQIEQCTRVQKEYLFPYYRLINWYFLCTVLPIAKVMYGAKQLNAAPCPEPIEDCFDEDLILLCQQISEPVVLNQMPYLVRSCELWLKEKGVTSAEVEAIKTAASGCGNAFSPACVTNAWWDLLVCITKVKESRSTERKFSSSTYSESFTSSILQHIEDVRSLESLDVLDGQYVKGVEANLESDLFNKCLGLHQLSSSSIDDPDYIGRSELQESSIFSEASSSNCKDLVLKLKINSSDIKNSSYVHCTRKCSGSVEQEAVRINNQDKPKAQYVSGISSANVSKPTLKLTLTGVNNNPSSTLLQREAPTSVMRDTANLNAKKKLDEAVNTAKTLLDEDCRNGRNMEPVCYSDRSHSYSTRGKKLSAAYLSQAMDIEIDNGYKGLYTNNSHSLHLSTVTAKSGACVDSTTHRNSDEAGVNQGNNGIPTQIFSEGESSNAPNDSDVDGILTSDDDESDSLEDDSGALTSESVNCTDSSLIRRNKKLKRGRGDSSRLRRASSKKTKTVSTNHRDAGSFALSHYYVDRLSQPESSRPPITNGVFSSAQALSSGGTAPSGCFNGVSTYQSAIVNTNATRNGKPRVAIGKGKDSKRAQTSARATIMKKLGIKL